MTSPVATLPIKGTWLTDPANPSGSLVLMKKDRTAQHTRDGSVKAYASGFRRIVITPADTGQSTLVFQRVTDDQLAQLIAWRGRILLLRDWQGWRRWGNFLDVQVVSLAAVDDPYEVTITWQDADYVEAAL